MYPLYQTIILLCATIAATICGPFSSAQVPDQSSRQEQELLINLAEKADLDLTALVQWLANEKKMRITANSAKFPSNTNNKVVFYGDVRVDAEAMLEVVQSILRTNGFALVKSDVKDLYQIVELADVRPFTQIVDDGKAGDFPNGEYVTGVFPLSFTTDKEAEGFVKQMIYGNATGNSVANISSLPNRNTLIITDTAKRLARIESLLKKIDKPGELILREFYKVQHLQSQELKQQLSEILAITASESPDPAKPASPNYRTLKIDAIVQTNQLLLSGSRPQIDEALKIIEQIDVENELTLRTYQFGFVAAKQVDELIRQSMKGLDENQVERLYQSNVNQQSNQLIATTRDEIHNKINALKSQLDKPASPGDGKSPMRFYELKNVKAIEILDTLQAIERRVGTGRSRNDRRLDNRLNGINARDGFGSNGFDLNNQNAFQGSFGQGNASAFDQFGSSSRGIQQNQTGQLPFGNSVVSDIARLTSGLDQAEKLIPGEAKVTVDENTNTLIVVAEPPIQELYAQLIKRLDVRRPQVLIEVQVVTITGQDDFNLGIDISGGDREGDRRLFAFTNFGLSEVDAATGALSIIPGLGFNGTLIDPGTADVVLRALARHRRARVITAPRILVNDNATGLLSSVAEVPFQSSNIGNTISTTSFGGFAQAGTTVSVTPQISDDDYLNLEFDILVNNFTGAASGDLPPPRNTDQVTSDVSIPDGHTVIVGGLTRKRLAEDLQGLPIIERIPILNRLTSNQVDEGEEQRLFVFIKPVILRNDKFRDLRFLSDSERREAQIPSDLPISQPILIR